MNNIKFVIVDVSGNVVSRHITMKGVAAKLEKLNCNCHVKAIDYVEWDGHLILRELNDDEINDLHIHSKEFPFLLEPA